MLFAAIAVSTVFVFNQSNPILLDISTVLLPALGIAWLVLGVYCVMQTGVRKDDRVSIVWFNFLLTAILWIMALFVFDMYPFIFGVITPTPSLSDVLEFAGYAPLLFGLLLQVWPFRSALFSRSMKGVMALVAIISATILYLILPPFLRVSGDRLAVAVNAAYPVLDVVCLAIAIPILVLFIRGTFWRPFLCIVVGLIFLLAADVMSGEAILSGTYFFGHPSDLIYIYGLLSGILGWHLRTRQFVTRSL